MQKDIEQFRNEVNTYLSTRDYYGAFKLITSCSEQYLQEKSFNYPYCIELMNQNQDLLEIMGSSKAFEMAFDLQNQLIANRNKLFLTCLPDDKTELKKLYKRVVGDFSKE
jgi:hypothetical protein